MRLAPLLWTALACAWAAIPPRPAAADPPPAAGALAPTAPTPPPPVVRYRLSNGLDVILQEDHRTPRVAVNVLYRVGARDQPRGFRGLAHVVEHVMFERAGHMTEPYIPALEALGGSDYNGVTTLDATHYHHVVPAEQLAAALWMESDRLAFLLARLDGAAFASARRAVLNEHRRRVGAAVGGDFVARAQAALFPDEHPYTNIAEEPAEVAAVTLDEARAFFQTWYAPASATLVLVGDFREDAARALVARYFAPVRASGAPGASPPPRAHAVLGPLDAERRYDAPTRGPTERLYVAWRTPAFFAPGDAELDLLADVITRRLTERLVHELELARSVHAHQVSRALGSVFAIDAVAGEGHTAAELLAATDRVLAALREEPPDPFELRGLQQLRASELLFDAEGLAGRAAQLAGYAQLTPGDPDLAARDRARYLAATRAGILRAARDWLPSSRRLVATLTRHETPDWLGAPTAARRAPACARRARVAARRRSAP